MPPALIARRATLTQSKGVGLTGRAHVRPSVLADHYSSDDLRVLVLTRKAW